MGKGLHPIRGRLDPTKWPDWEAQCGREIWRCYLPDTPLTQGRKLEAGPDLSMQLWVENLGDRSEAWVICRNKNGLEISRQNVRMVETIVWVKPPEAAPDAPV